VPKQWWRLKEQVQQEEVKSECSRPSCRGGRDLYCLRRRRGKGQSTSASSSAREVGGEKARS